MAINLTPAKLSSIPMLIEGGEAKIYDYTPEKLIKIFKPHIDIARKEKKVTMLLTSHLPASVVAPEEIVTINGKFAGYIMPRVRDAEQIHQLVKRKFLENEQLSNKDVVAIMVSVGSTINALHANGLLIGDISDSNILIKNGDPFFIDVDSRAFPAAYTLPMLIPKYLLHLKAISETEVSASQLRQSFTATPY
jgi:tRNA A-37 threonylcarbamoyl transferase component Bud32